MLGFAFVIEKYAFEDLQLHSLLSIVMVFVLNKA